MSAIQVGSILVATTISARITGHIAARIEIRVFGRPIADQQSKDRRFMTLMLSIAAIAGAISFFGTGSFIIDAVIGLIVGVNVYWQVYQVVCR